MGMYCDVTVATQDEFEKTSAIILGGLFPTQTATAESVSLEKAWHGVHYLLTGEPWGGEGPLAFLLSGDDEGDDEAPRWFSPEDTKEIHEALKDVSDEVFWGRFDADQMEDLDIYPGIWDEEEEELKEEYLMYFHDLKRVVKLAADSDRGLLVAIG